MLNVTQRDEEVFRQKALLAFEVNAVKHLRRDLATAVDGYSDDTLIRRVRDAVPRAASYGLKTQIQIMCFVDSSFLIGEHFDTDRQHDWARSLLSSLSLDAQDRANLLLAAACAIYQGTYRRDLL